jgi:serine/threonine-protein kinase
MLLAVAAGVGCSHSGPMLPAQGGDAFVRGAAAAGPQNLDFESGETPNGHPMFWFGGGDGYAIRVDENGAHSGKGAARLEWAQREKPGDEDWCTLTQCVGVDLWKWNRVRLSGYLKTLNADGAGLWMRVDEGEKHTLRFDNMLDRPVKGTTEWRRYEVVLDVPRTATRVCFGVVLVGGGTVWADDLSFEVVSGRVPETGSGEEPVE